MNLNTFITLFHKNGESFMILFFRSIMCCALICSGMGSAFAQNRFNVYTPDAEKFPKVRAFYEAADLNNVPIPGISSTDFRIVENGVTIPPADITQKCGARFQELCHLRLIAKIPVCRTDLGSFRCDSPPK